MSSNENIDPISNDANLRKDDSSRNPKPNLFIAECSVCGNGLLRPYRCENCQAAVAICDECESQWCSIEEVFHNPRKQPDGAFPECCHCHQIRPQWHRLELDELAAQGLDPFVQGHSE